MNINDVLALANAGFTKDEIMTLASAGGVNEPKPTQTQTGAETAPAQQTATPEAQQTQTTETVQTQTQAPLLSDAQIKQLAQALNVGNASIDVPPTVTIDEKMQEHFKNLLLGK